MCGFAFRSDPTTKISIFIILSVKLAILLLSWFFFYFFFIYFGNKHSVCSSLVRLIHNWLRYHLAWLIYTFIIMFIGRKRVSMCVCVACTSAYHRCVRCVSLTRPAPKKHRLIGPKCGRSSKLHLNKRPKVNKSNYNWLVFIHGALDRSCSTNFHSIYARCKISYAFAWKIYRSVRHAVGNQFIALVDLFSMCVLSLSLFRQIENKYVKRSCRSSPKTTRPLDRAEKQKAVRRNDSDIILLSIIDRKTKTKISRHPNRRTRGVYRPCVDRWRVSPCLQSYKWHNSTNTFEKLIRWWSITNETANNNHHHQPSSSASNVSVMPAMHIGRPHRHHDSGKWKASSSLHVEPRINPVVGVCFFACCSLALVCSVEFYGHKIASSHCLLHTYIFLFRCCVDASSIVRRVLCILLRIHTHTHTHIVLELTKNK